MIEDLKKKCNVKALCKWLNKDLKKVTYTKDKDYIEEWRVKLKKKVKIGKEMTRRRYKVVDPIVKERCYEMILEG